MPGVSGVTVVTNARVYYTTRGCGRTERPAFPAPSLWEGGTSRPTLAQTMRRDRETVSANTNRRHRLVRHAHGSGDRYSRDVSDEPRSRGVLDLQRKPEWLSREPKLVKEMSELVLFMKNWEFQAHERLTEALTAVIRPRIVASCVTAIIFSCDMPDRSVAGVRGLGEIPRRAPMQRRGRPAPEPGRDCARR
jgi:hypothetical protein